MQATTPPYLIQNNKITAIQDNDLLLNISPYEYTNYRIKLATNDSLVFYTDGLTEAKNKDSDELFGTGRLEQTLSKKNISTMKAKHSVKTILKVIRDEGFTIEDDITVQVYRHM
jgi:serine phosphatase RsbU (regulator of sigma subunit)